MQNSSKSVDVISHLSAMRNLLADPKSWTQGASARNKWGGVELSFSPSAVCWCLIGASARIDGRLFSDMRSIDAMIRALPDGFSDVVAFNDAETTTHADVLAVIDRAIALAKEEAAND